MMKTRWHLHKGVRTGDQLTLGERCADRLRNGMGSWTFIFSFLSFMILWGALNTLITINHWDPYPFILLNLFLSMLAGLQGGILLIASRRQDQVSSEAAAHTAAEVEETLRIVRALAGISDDE